QLAAITRIIEREERLHDVSVAGRQVPHVELAVCSEDEEAILCHAHARDGGHRCIRVPNGVYEPAAHTKRTMNEPVRRRDDSLLRRGHGYAADDGRTRLVTERLLSGHRVESDQGA